MSQGITFPENNGPAKVDKKHYSIGSAVSQAKKIFIHISLASNPLQPVFQVTKKALIDGMGGNLADLNDDEVAGWTYYTEKRVLHIVFAC